MDSDAVALEVGFEIGEPEARQPIGVGEEDAGDAALLDKGAQLPQSHPMGIQPAADIREGEDGRKMSRRAIVEGSGELAVKIPFRLLLVGGDAAVDGGRSCGRLGERASGRHEPANFEDRDAAVSASGTVTLKFTCLIPAPHRLSTDTEEARGVRGTEIFFHKA